MNWHLSQILIIKPTKMWIKSKPHKEQSNVITVGKKDSKRVSYNNIAKKYYSSPSINLGSKCLK